MKERPAGPPFDFTAFAWSVTCAIPHPPGFHAAPIVGSVLTFLGPSWDGPRRKYRPGPYYMRGPGPKWREKHLLDRTPAERHLTFVLRFRWIYGLPVRKALSTIGYRA